MKNLQIKKDPAEAGLFYVDHTGYLTRFALSKPTVLNHFLHGKTSVFPTLFLFDSFIFHKKEKPLKMVVFLFYVDHTGIEPVTSPMPWERSTK